ncbi:MAG TPA: hypothetical protein VHR47_08140 [Bacillota bacterium]|nr:hypothetical protein [Bacillota bacterium]
MLPKNLLPILNVAKVDERHAKSLLQLIIAHELTHALQDQKTDLRRAYKIMDADQLSAFSATIERHAVWTQEVVGRQLRLNESVVEMSRLLSAGSVKYDDPALEMINKTIATQFEEVYLGGEKFISYHYQHGGNERVWQIIANPPLKTSMIALPVTYSAKPQAELNYAKLFDGLENKLDGEGWEVRNIGLGHMVVKSVYAQMEEADQSQILAQVQHVQSFVAQNDTLESTFNISVVTMKDAKFAPTYLQLLEKMVKKNVEMLRSSPSMQIKIFAITNFEPFPNDPSHKVLLHVFSGDGSDSSKQIFVRVFKDNLMLEFYLCNFDMNDPQITEIIEEILGRYQKLLKA